MNKLYLLVSINCDRDMLSAQTFDREHFLNTTAFTVHVHLDVIAIMCLSTLDMYCACRGGVRGGSDASRN